MNFHQEDGDIPTAKGSEKRSNLAKDEKIKNFWDKLVDEWLNFRGKPREKDGSKN